MRHAVWGAGACSSGVLFEPHFSFCEIDCLGIGGMQFGVLIQELFFEGTGTFGPFDFSVSLLGYPVPFAYFTASSLVGRIRVSF